MRMVYRSFGRIGMEKSTCAALFALSPSTEPQPTVVIGCYHRTRGLSPGLKVTPIEARNSVRLNSAGPAISL